MRQKRSITAYIDETVTFQASDIVNGINDTLCDMNDIDDIIHKENFVSFIANSVRPLDICVHDSGTARGTGDCAPRIFVLATTRAPQLEEVLTRRVDYKRGLIHIIK